MRDTNLTNSFNTNSTNELRTCLPAGFTNEYPRVRPQFVEFEDEFVQPAWRQAGSYYLTRSVRIRTTSGMRSAKSPRGATIRAVASSRKADAIGLTVVGTR